MAISCEPNDLADAAKCFMDIPWNTRQAIRIINWCAFLNGESMTCTPAFLANAARCFVGTLSARQIDAIETYLSCQIVNSGGGGGGAVQVFSGHYGGSAPTDVPTTSAAFAYDLDSPFKQWVWDGAAWT